MDKTIFAENQNLKRKLDNLIRRARTNEQKQALFDSFGFEVIAANTPAQLRDYILLQMQARFQLQDVIMCVIDFEHDAEKLFYGHDVDAGQLFRSKLIILDTEHDKNKIDTLPMFPALGPIVIEEYDWMIEPLDADTSRYCESAVLLPLIRNDLLIGTLLLLSRDINRYQPGIATNFLQKLSAMTAVAIENCLNQQRLKEIGYQDPLTQAYNRRYFDLRFSDEIDRCLRKDESLACMFLDVDFFKKVNDTYGHHTGDMVLMRLVVLMKEQVRACDIVARYGGEEFVVVLPDVSIDVAVEIAERLRKAVENDELISCDQGVKVTVSIGLDTIHNAEGGRLSKAEIGTQLLNNADQALYSAKSGGRNKVVVYNED